MLWPADLQVDDALHGATGFWSGLLPGGRVETANGPVHRGSVHFQPDQVTEPRVLHLDTSQCVPLSDWIFLGTPYLGMSSFFNHFTDSLGILFSAGDGFNLSGVSVHHQEQESVS